MPDLLLELFSEEIPARMQAKAAEDLKALVTGGLIEAGLTYEGAKAFATPRRLALTVHGLTARSPDLAEERKGPRVGSPEKALEGFLKGAGLGSIAEARIVSDPKKGDFYVADIRKPGRPAEAIIAELVPQVVRGFPWPKSMRWGAGSLRWVRPLHTILCTFGPETEEPEVVDFEVDGIRSGDTTAGHRFLAPARFRVKRFEDYAASLEKAKVVLDPARRRDIILHDARDLALASGLELIEDDGLLAEVAGLVEWPVVLMGSFDAAFLAIPPEVIRATIRANQKCFVLRDPATGGLANRFLLTANIAARDGGQVIVAGNERVIRARLSDAKFFYEQDLAASLESRLPKLEKITFHEKLGTQAARVARIAALAREIAPLVGADADLAERAANLAKADLVTGMVGEFPELQGLMGRYYAAAQGEDPAVAAAIEEHYKPQGPGDRTPTAPVSIAVALADKLDTLTGFWAIDEKPTGSKDPYALRRAALGVIRIVLENGLRLPLLKLLRMALALFFALGIRPRDNYSSLFRHFDPARDQRTEPHWASHPSIGIVDGDGLIGPHVEAIGLFEMNNPDLEPNFDTNIVFYREKWTSELEARLRYLNRLEVLYWFEPVFPEFPSGDPKSVSGGNGRLKPVEMTEFLSEQAWSKRFLDEKAHDLLAFFHDRLKVQLREQGARHDLVDAVLAESVASPPLPVPPPRGGRGPLGEGGASVVPSPLEGEGQGGGEPAAERSAPATDDLVLVVRRVEALGALLATEDGASLLAGYRRAANILKAEEKKDGVSYDALAIDHALLETAGLPEEKVLVGVLEAATGRAEAHLVAEDFAGAMRTLAELRPAIDAFFAAVLVNAEDPAIRRNRLAMLAGIRAACHLVADFSRISG